LQRVGAELAVLAAALPGQRSEVTRRALRMELRTEEAFSIIPEWKTIPFLAWIMRGARD
jgi:hypothetical protein